jgi:surfeit locus 1 family protein
MRIRDLVGLFVAVAAIIAALSLAQWQSGRAQQKLAQQSAWDAAQAAAPVELRGADVAAVADRLPQRVRLRGTWVQQHAVWLDNRTHQGRAGFLLLMPLQLETGELVLVNRGFGPRDGMDRQRLPQVRTEAGTQSVLGIALPQPSRVLALGADPDAGDSGPLIWQNLDYRRYEQATGISIARWVLQQTDGAEDGLRRDWPAWSAGVEKHRGYAFQWNALAAIIAVCTGVLGFRVRRDRRNRVTSAS